MVANKKTISPAVSVPEILPVVTGERDLTLDAAIREAAEIQAAERDLNKRKERIREAIEFSMRRAGLSTYTEPSGHSATLFSQTVETLVGKDAARELLSPEDFAKILKVRTDQKMKIT